MSQTTPTSGMPPEVILPVEPQRAAQKNAPRYQPNPYGFEIAGDGNAAGIFEYWAIIRQKRGLILGSGILGLLIGFAAGIPMKSIYRAKTTIEVLAMNEDFMNMKETNPVNSSNDSDVSEEETQAELLRSDTILKRVAARLNPITPPTTAPIAAGPRWRTLLHLPLQAPIAPRAALVAKAADTLKVHAEPRTRIIEATVDSPDPKFAADYLNTLAQEFIHQNQESRLNAIERTGDWLNHELGDARDKLRVSEDALQKYARNSGIIFADNTTNVATEKLQQLQQALSTASAERIAKQSRYELAQSSPPESLADVLNDSSLHDTQAKINNLRSQIADLSTIFNPGYSKLRRLQSELNSLQTAFDRRRAAILARIKTDYEEAARNERLLASAYNDQTRAVTVQGEKTIQYNILKREVDSNRQLYDAMLQQMKQASIATAMRASNVRVIDAADIPVVPVFPNFKVNSALGCFAGLVFSMVVVVIRDQMDRTVQRPGDIKQWAELSELGAIPNAAAGWSKSYVRYYGSANITGRGNSAGPAELPAGSPVNSLELAPWKGKPSLFAECFRSALTSILSADERGRQPQVLVFTSATPTEGKTTTVSNLAVAACEIRLKVIVIDADFRRPRLHDFFDLSNDRGLSDILQGEINTDTLGSRIQQTKIQNLHVLSAGPQTYDATQLLCSPTFAALIKLLRAEYDMVLIDTPPMLHMTDARIVGRQADAVVLVARAGQTTRESLAAARERFSGDRIRVLGGILNDCDLNRFSKLYYKV